MNKVIISNLFVLNWKNSIYSTPYIMSFILIYQDMKYLLLLLGKPPSSAKPSEVAPPSTPAPLERTTEAPVPVDRVPGKIQQLLPGRPISFCFFFMLLIY